MIETRINPEQVRIIVGRGTTIRFAVSIKDETEGPIDVQAANDPVRLHMASRDGKYSAVVDGTYAITDNADGSWVDFVVDHDLFSMDEDWDEDVMVFFAVRHEDTSALEEYVNYRGVLLFEGDPSSPVATP